MSIRRLFILLTFGFVPATQLVCPLNVLGDSESAERNMKQERQGPKARELSTADPDQDFASARRMGDIHFLAMRGFTIDVPGVAPEHEYLIRRVGTKVIEGTSDVVGGESGRQIRKKVRKYAERYNQLVVNFLLRQRSKK